MKLFYNVFEIWIVVFKQSICSRLQSTYSRSNAFPSHPNHEPRRNKQYNYINVLCDELCYI